MGSKTKAPLFQRRHYETVAARFKMARLNGSGYTPSYPALQAVSFRPQEITDIPPLFLDRMMIMFSDMFDEDNDNFDRERFMEACKDATEE